MQAQKVYLLVTFNGGENIERMQLKMGEFRSVAFFGRYITGNSFISRSDHRRFAGIRMNFKIIVSVSGNYLFYGTGNWRKQYDIWLPISNFFKRETVFINPSSEQTVNLPWYAPVLLSPMQHMMWKRCLYVRASIGIKRRKDCSRPRSSGSISVGIPGAFQESLVWRKSNQQRAVRSGSSVAASLWSGNRSIMHEWAFVVGI